MFRGDNGQKMGADLIWPPGVVASTVIVPLNIKCSVNNARGLLELSVFQFYSRLFQVFPLSVE